MYKVKSSNKQYQGRSFDNDQELINSPLLRAVCDMGLCDSLGITHMVGHFYLNNVPFFDSVWRLYKWWAVSTFCCIAPFESLYGGLFLPLIVWSAWNSSFEPVRLCMADYICHRCRVACIIWHSLICLSTTYRQGWVFITYCMWFATRPYFTP